MVQEFRPSDYRIEELVIKVRDGDIKLPKFQRPFVWRRADILRLFDSVYNMYPIGSILLWFSSEKLASERKIGDLEINYRPDSLPTLYLLDGQQRLSSLCGALYWDGRDEKSIWNVSFDLEKERFVHLKEEEHRLWHFPLNKLLDTFDFMSQCQGFEKHEKKDKYKEKAERLLRSMKDYKIAAVTIGDMRINEVAPIFERINSSGRQLTLVDLMRAATWSDGFDLNDAIDSVRIVLEDRNFAAVPESHILRNISASSGLGIHKESIDKLREQNHEALQEAAKHTAEAYKLAVDFLVDDLLLSSFGYLPYALQLTFLVEFFRICPSPDIQKRKILKNWFWDTSFSRHFGRSNTGQQTADLKSIRSFAEEQKDNLEVEEKIKYHRFVLDSFRLNKAASKSFALLLAYNSPRSLLDGAPINTQQALSVLNKGEYHHIFPRAFLQSSGCQEEKINVAANICMLNLGSNRRLSGTRPSVYFAEMQENLGNEIEQVLASNFMNMDAYKAGLDENYEGFLKIRANLLIQSMQNIVSEYQRDEKLIETQDEEDEDIEEESEELPQEYLWDNFDVLS